MIHNISRVQRTMYTEESAEAMFGPPKFPRMVTYLVCECGWEKRSYDSTESKMDVLEHKVEALTAEVEYLNSIAKTAMYMARPAL